MVNRRTYLRLTGAAISGVALSGCSGGQDGGDGGGDGGADGSGGDGGADGSGGDGGDSGDGSDGTTTGSRDLKYTATFGSIHYPLVPHGFPLHVASQKGFFEEYDIEAEEVVSVTSGSPGLRTVASGSVDAGVLNGPAAINAYMAGSPVYIAANANPKPVIDWTTPVDTDIEKIQDLAGGTIAATNPGGSVEALAKLSVERAEGISLDEVEIMFAGGLGEGFAAVSEGIADVCANSPPVNIQFMNGGKHREVWRSREFLPDYPEDVLIMGQRPLKEEPDLGRGIINGFMDAVTFIRENMDESAQMWADAADIKKSTALEALEYCDPEQFYGVEVTEANKEAMTTVMRVLDFIDEDQEPPWDEAFDPSLIPSQ
jgi:ABC-type nitrate/sulfonate/bicarbonate transport system substrate-binding protein